MTRLIEIIIGLCALSFLWSCKKALTRNDTTAYIVDGHLYEDCGNKPVSQGYLRLYKEEYRSLSGKNNGGTLSEAVTDVNGYFRFEFKDNLVGEGEEIDLYENSVYRKLMFGLPTHKSVRDLVLYRNINTALSIFLDVKNPYTQKDTMSYYIPGIAEEQLLPGPFVSGTLFTTSEYPVFFMTYSESFHSYAVRIGTTQIKKEFAISDYCDTTVVTLTIE